jgi:hypothetical protein
MNRFFGLKITLLALALSACESWRPGPPAAIVIPTPGADEALLYVFRPKADEVAVSDLPLLSVDGQPPVVLAKGFYLLAQLRPGPQESPSWNAEQAVVTEGGEVYFVAVWHQDQPESSRYTMALPLKHALLFIPMGGHAGSLSGVQLELVDREVATIGLAGLRSVAP